MEYGILGWIVVGLIAGTIAKWIMPGRDLGGIIVTILIGVTGGVLGGFISSRIGLSASGHLENILIATAGAVLLLWIYGFVKSRSQTRVP